MAGRARDTEKRTSDTEKRTSDTEPPPPERAGSRADAGGTTALAEDVHPEGPAEGRFEGHRSATVNLPFVTAQFRVPDLHVPTRDDLGAAARGARSMLPSGKAMLFFGGLTATAVAGVIEWPVAAAIGIGSAMASRGAANPEPRGGTPQAAQATTSETSSSSDTETSGTSNSAGTKA